MEKIHDKEWYISHSKERAEERLDKELTDYEILYLITQIQNGNSVPYKHGRHLVQTRDGIWFDVAYDKDLKTLRTIIELRANQWKLLNEKDRLDEHRARIKSRRRRGSGRRKWDMEKRFDSNKKKTHYGQ